MEEFFDLANFRTCWLGPLAESRPTNVAVEKRGMDMRSPSKQARQRIQGSERHGWKEERQNSEEEVGNGESGEGGG